MTTAAATKAPTTKPQILKTMTKAPNIRNAYFKQKKYKNILTNLTYNFKKYIHYYNIFFMLI